MRILAAINAPSRHLSPLLAEWRRMGHEVAVVVDRPVGRLGEADLFWREGIGVHSLNSEALRSKRLFVLADVGSLVARADAVVVGGYAAQSARSVLRIPCRRRPPTVLLAERPDHRTSGLRREVRDAFIRWAVNRVDAVWAMSEQGRVAFLGFGANVPILVPYPCPDPVPREKVDLKSEHGVFRITIIGSLDNRKDPLLAAAALHELASRDVRFLATFYGDGPLREALNAATVNLPVRIAGQVSPEDINEALQSSDVLLHTSQEDGWGMVVAEAAAAEVAVVAGPWTDAATELARMGTTVRVVELSPERIADELQVLAELCRDSEHQQALRSTRETAQLRVGATAVARRAIEDLERRVSSG